MNKDKVEQVRNLILEFRPDEEEVLDEQALVAAAAYLDANGYLEERVQDEDPVAFEYDPNWEPPTDDSVYYFVYDVLKYTFQNRTTT